MKPDDDILSTMSHELRAPLHAILGWVQLLRAGGMCGPEAEHALEIIERNARMESRAVDEAIDLARLAGGQLEIERNDMRLVESLRAAVAANETAAAERKVHLQVDSDPDVRVIGDLGRLAQIARGLIASAIRRSAIGGTVEIGLSQKNGHAILSVREDRGAADADAAVFERDNSRTRRAALFGDARGIAVAVARGLLKLHGGTLEDDEGGAMLIARLPLAPSAIRASAIGSSMRM